MKWDVEYTDTFGGEANYCWVRRAVVNQPGSDRIGNAKVDRALKRAIKAAVGITGLRGTWNDNGDMLEFRPRGVCTVLFAHWHDCGGTCEHCRA